MQSLLILYTVSTILSNIAAKLIKDITEEVDAYKSGFVNVVELFNKRNLVVEESLNPAGLSMRKQMTDVMTSAYNDNDTSAAFHAAQVQEHLLLGRLYVVKYLVTNSDSDHKRAEKELLEILPPLVTKLNEEIENPERLKLLEEFKRQYVVYTDAFENVTNTIQKRNDLIKNTLNSIGPTIASHIEEVKLSVKEEQDHLGPEIQSQTEFTITAVTWLSIIALIFGVAIAWVMAKVIRQPIGGEPRDIAEITQAIANGDLTQVLEISEKDTGIYRSVGNMSHKLKELIGGVINNSESLAESAGIAAQASSETTKIVSKQQTKTTSIVASIHEMATSIQEVVNHATASATDCVKTQIKSLISRF
jgi:methyl-accepting chemotaxis protein